MMIDIFDSKGIRAVEELIYHRKRFSERNPKTWTNKNYKLILDTYYREANLKLEMFDGATILDVGGGPTSGLYHSPFDKATRRVVVDPLSKEFQHFIRDKFIHFKNRNDVEEINGRAEAIPLSDSTFDYILNFNGIDHWGDWHQGIREVCRVMKTGGWQFLYVNLDRPSKTPGHPHEITREESIEWILQLGFVLLYEKAVWRERPNNRRRKSFYSIMEKI